MQGFSFGEFMKEGGWGMIPVLLFGLVGLGAAARFAYRPAPRWLAFAGAMWLTVLAAVGHAIITNLTSVFMFLGGPPENLEGQSTRVLFIGLKESLRPGVMGGLFLTLTLLALSIGAFRARWGEPA
jgi:hypothetical protein